MKLPKKQLGFISPQIIVVLLIIALILLAINYFNLGNIFSSVSKSSTPLNLKQKNDSTVNEANSSVEKIQVQNQKEIDALPDESVYEDTSPVPTSTPTPTQINSNSNTPERQARESAPEEGTPANNPVFGNFRIIDFNTAYNLTPMTIITPPSSVNSSFINSIIGKIRIPNIVNPTITPTPASESQQTALVISLDTVKIHDDKDPALNGEVQIVTSARTAFTEQLTAWPYRNWDEANDGDTLKVNMPVFVLPKDQVGDKISLWMSVVDNDSLPGGAEDLIQKAYEISTGNKSFFDNPTNFIGDVVYQQTINRFLGWLGSEEHIGTEIVDFLKPQYSMWTEGHKYGYFNRRSGDATFNYSIQEVTIPQKPLHVDVTIKKIHSDETGDYDLAGWKGDIYVYARVSDGFGGGREMHTLPTRIPESGEHEMRDNTTWDINKEILSANVSSPVLYYEVGVWDADPSGNNDDQLEIVTKTLKMADYKAGDVLTITEDGDDGVDADAEITMEVKFSEAN